MSSSQSTLATKPPPPQHKAGAIKPKTMEKIMKTGIKTIDSLPKKHSIKIADVSDERAIGDGVWIYLADGFYCFEFDPFYPSSTIHEQTVGACISRLKRARKPINSKEIELVKNRDN